MIPRFACGQLSQRVTIQTLDSTPDRGGGRSKTWLDIATVWASVEPLRGEELVYAMKISDRITHKIVMRYRELEPKQRLVHKGQPYNIRSILNEGSRNRKLVILAEQGVAT